MKCSSCGTSNPDTANFCVQCGRALKVTDRPRSFVEWLYRGTHTEGERRQVTILACDTVGSSLLAEQMDPEEFLVLMNRAFERILAPIFEFDGYLARLEGDGFKAFFGAPEAHEDDPLRAVRAGLAIQTAARRFSKELQQEGRASEFSVRVGVHTDHVVVGPVGTGEVVEYTAMGIGIVLAKRLEEIAQPGTVLISETTQRLIEPYCQVVPLGPTAVKGRSQPVHVFEVTALRPQGELGDALGIRSPLVGRRVELSMLEQAVAKLLSASAPKPRSVESLQLDVEESPDLHQGEVADPEAKPSSRTVPIAQVMCEETTDRRGGTVNIIGEAGVGKSRLMLHVRARMTAEHPALIWLDGHAVNRGQGTFGVLADLIHCYLGIGVDDRTVDIFAKLRHRLERLFTAPVGSTGSGSVPSSMDVMEVDDLLAHLANLLSLPLEGAQAQRVFDLDPEAQERQIFRAMRRLFERLAQDGPVVLALDDLQSADEGTVRLLSDLMQLAAEQPILFVFSFRPEPGAPCWQLRDVARHRFEKDKVEIVLHSLSTDASNALIENLLEIPKGEELFESVRALIRNRSGGNPLFIEEVIRSLIDRGILERSGSRWQLVSEVPENYIPETLHGVVSARLDRLDPGIRRILQIAAVIGRTFSPRVLQMVMPGADNDIEHCLSHLQRSELVRELGRGTEQEYTFTHMLIQQVAYETLLRRQRRTYHRRVANSIEQLYADRLEEYYERLAFHYANAEDWPLALKYHIKFATQAQLRYANAKATEHYQRAWEIVRLGHAGDKETECLLYEAQANLDLLAGAFQQAIANYRAALDLAHEVPDRARILRKLGNVCQALGNYDEGVAYLHRGLDLSDTIGRGPELASLYVSLGQIYHRQGENERATELGLLALEIFEEIVDQRGTALASNLLGITYWAMGDLDTARSYLEKSLLTHASLGDVHGLAASYNNLGRVLADQGQLKRAMSNFQQSQQLCMEIGHQHGLATALSHLSELYQRLGQTEEAWACQEQAFEIYNRIGFDGIDFQPEVLKMQVW
jgi:class 3 adenylate cyclase/tetratricopeptide (TPR) repeat protein